MNDMARDIMFLGLKIGMEGVIQASTMTDEEAETPEGKIALTYTNGRISAMQEVVNIVKRYGVAE